MRKILISFHDICPSHIHRIKKGEALLRSWGVSHLSFLYIPDYHGLNDQINRSDWSEYLGWIDQKQSRKYQWILHGYSHLRKQPSNRDAVQSKRRIHLFSGGEEEFLDLDSEKIREHLEKGIDLFRNQFSRKAKGFIAPAWKYNPALIPILREMDFKMTENHDSIYLLREERSIDAPVITWATRSILLKYSSLLVCPQLERLWRRREHLRLAVHPYDFDHTTTIRNIEKVIKRALRNRQQILYSDLHQDSTMHGKCQKTA